MVSPSSRLRGLLSELRRRRVFRVALVYGLVAWAVAQVADLAFPALRLPGWTTTLVVALAILGFPVAVALAWAFDITPEGVRKTERAVGDASRTADPDTAAADTGRTADADATADAEPPSRRRLAVLPLANISPDRQDEYFADGMTEELISTLSKLRDLEVIARTSVIQYRDATKDVATIGRELEAGTLLEGSVRRAGDRLRITVQLIDTASQAHLWSEDYDRDLKDVFAIQTEIARQVADALEVRLLGGVERPARAPTDDLAAYELYLLGRHHWNQRNDEGIRKAIAHFEAAIEKDPGYAEAHAGLADAYTFAAIGYAALPPRDALSRARTAAQKALELDETLPEAHTSLALTRMLHDWDWEAAEREFRRALELNPSLARAHQWYAWYFLGRRRYEDSLRQFRRALELDPLSVVLNTEAGWPYNYMDEPDLAIEQYRKALALDPEFALAHFDLGLSYEQKGMYEEAISAYRRSMELSGGAPFTLALLARTLAATGRTNDARDLLAELLERSRDGYAVALYVAIVYEALGDVERALDWLEKACRDREPLFLFWLDTRFLPFESVRGDPQFTALLKEIGLPT